MLKFPTGPFLTDLLVGYFTLFSIINPLGLSFVFLSRTHGLTEPERVAIARRIGLYSFIVLVSSLFIGTQIMHMFGITLSALRISGGMVVALSGWAMLNAPDDSDTIVQPAPDPQKIRNAAFFPLTVPLTTGPGSIAASIALAANRSGDLRELVFGALASLFVAILVAVTVTMAYSRASAFSRWAGAEGTRVITRLSAFLLMAVGVQIMMTGIEDFLPGIIARGLRPQ